MTGVWSSCRSADKAGLWTFFGMVRHFGASVHKPADLGRSMDTFRYGSPSDLWAQSQTCWPWQVYGHFLVWRKLVSQTCRPWQVYGHFLVWRQTVHKPADPGRSMDSVRNLLTLAGLWKVFNQANIFFPFRNPTCLLSDRRVGARERKIMPRTMATTFMPAACQHLCQFSFRIIRIF